MHILFDARHLNHPTPGGVGEYSWEIMKALAALDGPARYSVLTSGGRRPKLVMPGANWSLHHFPLPNKLLNLSLLTSGRPFLDRLVPEVDAVFLPNLNIASLSPRVPLILTVHDLAYLVFPEFFSQKMRWWHRAVRPDRLIRRAAAIITPSQRTKRDLELLLGIAPEKIQVIPHGVAQSFQPEPQAVDADVAKKYLLPSRFVLFLGTLEPRKNLFLLVDGVGAYRKKTGIDLHLVLAGTAGWKSRDFRRLIHRPEYRRWIHHLGYVPASQRPSLYRLSQALVWPSLYEGFGLPPLEAMACGTPVITSPTASLPEVAGICSLLIDPYDSHSLTQALLGLFDSPALAARLRAAGLTAAKNFTWAKAAQATQEVFFRVAGNKP